jgi:DNA-binding phage protein
MAHRRIIIAYYYSVSRPPASDEQRELIAALQDVLRHRRLQRELSLEALAHASGVNRRTLDKFFSAGTASPSFLTVARLCRPLGLRLDAVAREAGIL